MSFLFEPKLFVVVLLTLYAYWRVAETRQQQWLVLTLVSLGLLFCVHPIFCVAILFSGYFIHLCIHWRDRSKIAPVALIVVMSVTFLVVGKYGISLIETLAPKYDWVTVYLMIPMGISYFFLRMLHYALGSYRGTVKNNSPLRLIAYLSFFPLVPAGPIETYDNFVNNRNLRFDKDQFGIGVRRIIWGYFKKLFVVELILETLPRGFVSEQVQSVYHAEPIALFALGLLSFLRAYVDLSAYSDIAIGLSALFGFKVMENFNLPLFSKNIGEFWRRWHISLSTWCRDQVYFPTFGLFRSPGLAVYASMLFMGIWHQFTLNWVAWGIYHGTGITLHLKWQKWKRGRGYLNRVLNSIWLKPLGILATLSFVAIGHLLVSIPDATEAMWAVGRVYFTLIEAMTGAFS